MSEEQEPVGTEPTTTTPEVDPSINPTKLVVQEGEFAGAVNAFETSPATFLDDNGEKKEGVANSEQPYQIGGLPVIGAQAEVEARDEIKHFNNLPNEVQGKLNDKWQEHRKSQGETNEATAAKYYDEAGTDAMAAEVKKKAMALVPEVASDEVREEYGEIAATKFRDELKIKLAERKEAEEAAAMAEAERKAAEEEAEKKAATEAADATTREMIDKLKDTGTKLSDVIDVPEAPLVDHSHEESVGDSRDFDEISVKG